MSVDGSRIEILQDDVTSLTAGWSSEKIVEYVSEPPGLGGDVTGPDSATDNALCRFDTTTGKLIQNSSATLSDAGVLSAAGLAVTSQYTLPSADGLASQRLTTDGAGTVTWESPPGDGDVTGPASSTDNALARYDSTSGKLLQNSSLTLSDAGTLQPTMDLGGTLGGPTNRWADIYAGSADVEINLRAEGLTMMNSGVDEYALPNTDGTSGQVMTTDGAGAASWATASDLPLATTTDTTCGVVLAENQNSTPQSLKYDAGLLYNASTNILTVGGVDIGSEVGATISQGLIRATGDGALELRYPSTTYGIRVNASNEVETRTVLPATDDTYDIGSTGSKFSNGYIDNIEGATATLTSSLTTEGLTMTSSGGATFSLPNTDGSASQVLATDGAGTVSWASNAGGNVSGPTAPSGVLSVPYNYPLNGSLVNFGSEGGTAAGFGTIVYANDRFGDASSCFDSTDGSFNMMSINYLDGVSNWTISCWIYPETTGSVGQVLRVQSGTGFGTNRFGLEKTDDEAIQLNGTNFSSPITSTTTVATDTWYYLSVVRDGSNVELFVNNISEGTTTVATWWSGTDVVRVGTSDQTGGSASPFQGRIDSLRLYMNTLNETQRAQDANNATPTFDVPSGGIVQFTGTDGDTIDTAPLKKDANNAIVPAIGHVQDLGAPATPWANIYTESITIGPSAHPSYLVSGLDPGAQTIPNTTVTVFENWDSPIYSTTGITESAGVFTIDGGTYPGMYILNSDVNFASNSTGIREVYIQKTPAGIIQRTQVTATNGGDTALGVTGLVHLTESAGYRLIVVQNSGGDLDIINGRFQVTRIH